MIAYYFVYLENELAAIFYICQGRRCYQAELKLTDRNSTRGKETIVVTSAQINESQAGFLAKGGKPAPTPKRMKHEGGA